MSKYCKSLILILIFNYLFVYTGFCQQYHLLELCNMSKSVKSFELSNFKVGNYLVYKEENPTYYVEDILGTKESTTLKPTNDSTYKWRKDYAYFPEKITSCFYTNDINCQFAENYNPIDSSWTTFYMLFYNEEKCLTEKCEYYSQKTNPLGTLVVSIYDEVQYKNYLKEINKDCKYLKTEITKHFDKNGYVSNYLYGSFRISCEVKTNELIDNIIYFEGEIRIQYFNPNY